MAPQAVKKFWIADDKEGYVLAEVDPRDENKLKSRNGKTVPRANGTQANPPDMDLVPDCTQLMFLNEPGMLHNIKCRYGRDNIYTYTGYILLAVNPYKKLPIYTEDVIREYTGKSIGKLPPHVFAIADRAYRAMRTDMTDQSIMISGESGAGKTETAKLVMQYLVKVGGRTFSESAGTIEDRIIATNPLMEAFGNAKTLRNNNSSRFGKFIRILFDDNAQVVGAAIDTYLLEKSRVVGQSEGNRNYHIFYLLCAGLSADAKKKLHLTRPEDYHYLRQGGDYNIPDWSDKDFYDDVVKAMRSIGISQDEENSLYRMLAALLHLGNIEFSQMSKREERATIKNMKPVNVAAELFEVDENTLLHTLLNRTITTRGEKTVIPLRVQEAERNRDGIVKSVYNEMFLWLVGRINDSLKGQHESVASISILDIFGFEYFQTNSFEQFCINYTNEKLQQQFNQQIFKEELDIYKREGIIAPKVQFIDNQECLDLIEQPGTGILSILKEQSRLPKATDATFASAMFSRNARHPNLARPKVSASNQSNYGRDEAFIVKHYAADVCYETDGFLDKNNDSINADLLALMTTSKLELLANMFDAVADTAAASAPATPGSRPGSMRGEASPAVKRTTRIRTVIGTFSEQLHSLVDTLNQTSCQFIRCIKPNSAQKPATFDPIPIMDQLRCNGMFDALTLMHAGYPTRCPYDDLYRRFRPMMPDKIARLSPKLFCEALIIALDCDRDDFELGLTRVFFRTGKLAFLEELRGEGKTKFDAALIDRIVCYLARKRFRTAIWTVRANWRLTRRLQQMRALKKFVRAAFVMRRIACTWVRLARRIKQLGAAIKIQSTYRMHQQRKEYHALRSATIKAQAMLRGLLVFRAYAKKRAELRQERLQADAEVKRAQAAEIARLRSEEARKKREKQEQESAARRARNEAEEAKIEAARLEKERREKEEYLQERARVELDMENTIRERVAKAEEGLRQQITDANARCETLEQELQERSAMSASEVDELTSKLDESQNALQGLEETVSKLENKNKQAANELMETRKRHENAEMALRQQIADAELVTKQRQESLEAANVALEKERAEREADQRAIGLLETDLEKVQLDFGQTRSELAEAQQSLEQERQRFSGDMARSEARSQALERQLTEAADNLESMMAAHQRAETKLKGELDEMETQKQHSEQQRVTLQEQVATAEGVVSQRQRLIDDLQEQLSQERAARQALERELAALRMELTELRANNDRLRKLLSSAEEEMQQLRNSHAQALTDASERKAQSDRAVHDLQAELEDAQHVLRRTERKWQEQLDIANEDKTKAEAQKTALDARVDEMERTLEMRQREIAGLREEVHQAQKTGSADAVHQVASLRAELDGTYDTLAQTRALLAAAQQQSVESNDKHQLDLQEARNALGLAESKMREAEQDAEDAQRALRKTEKRLKEELEDVQIERDRLAADKTRLQRDMEAAQTKLKNEHSEYSSRRQELEAMMEANQSQQRGWDVEKSVMRAQLETSEAQCERLRSELGETRTEVDRLQKEMRDVEDQKSTLAGQSVQAAQHSMHLESAISKLRSKLASEVTEAESEVSAKQSKIEVLRREYEKERREWIEQGEQAQQDLDERDEQIHKLKVELAVLKIKVDDYERSMDEVSDRSGDLQKRLDSEIAEHLKNSQDWALMRSELNNRLADMSDDAQRKEVAHQRALHKAAVDLECVQEENDALKKTVARLQDSVESLSGKLSEMTIKKTQDDQESERASAGSVVSSRTDVERAVLSAQISELKEQARSAQQSAVAMRKELDQQSALHSKEQTEFMVQRNEMGAKLERVNRTLVETQMSERRLQEEAAEYEKQLEEQQELFEGEKAKLQAQLDELQAEYARPARPPTVPPPESETERALYARTLELKDRLRDFSAATRIVSQAIEDHERFLPQLIQNDEHTLAALMSMMRSMRTMLDNVVKAADMEAGGKAAGGEADDAASTTTEDRDNAELKSLRYADEYIDGIHNENTALRKKLGELQTAQQTWAQEMVARETAEAALKEELLDRLQRMADYLAEFAAHAEGTESSNATRAKFNKEHLLRHFEELSGMVKQALEHHRMQETQWSKAAGPAEGAANGTKETGTSATESRKLRRTLSFDRAMAQDVKPWLNREPLSLPMRVAPFMMPSMPVATPDHMSPMHAGQFGNPFGPFFAFSFMPRFHLFPQFPPPVYFDPFFGPPSPMPGRVVVSRRTRSRNAPPSPSVMGSYSAPHTPPPGHHMPGSYTPRRGVPPGFPLQMTPR